MECSICGRPAEEMCEQCGRAYCAEHRVALCRSCAPSAPWRAQRTGSAAAGLPLPGLFQAIVGLIFLAAGLNLGLLAYSAVGLPLPSPSGPIVAGPARPAEGSPPSGGASGSQSLRPLSAPAPAETATPIPSSTTPTPTATPTPTSTPTPTPTATASPTATITPTVTPTPTATATSTPTREPYVRYRVETGDSLSSIARDHRTTVDALRRLNGLESDFLRTGQTLLVPRE